MLSTVRTTKNVSKSKFSTTDPSTYLIDCKDSESDEEYINTNALKKFLQNKKIHSANKQQKISNKFNKHKYISKDIDNDSKDSDSDYEITKEDIQQEINDIIEDIQDTQKLKNNKKLSKDEIIDKLCDDYYSRTGHDLDISIISNFFKTINKEPSIITDIFIGDDKNINNGNIIKPKNIKTLDFIKSKDISIVDKEELFANEFIDTFEKLNGRLPTLNELKNMFKKIKNSLDKDNASPNKKGFTDAQTSFANAVMNCSFNDTNVLELAKQVIIEDNENKSFYEFAKKTNRSPGINELNKYKEIRLCKILNDFEKDKNINIKEIINKIEIEYSDDEHWVDINKKENIKNLLKKDTLLKVSTIKDDLGEGNIDRKIEDVVENIAGQELSKDEQELLDMFLIKHDELENMDEIDDENDSDYNPENVDDMQDFQKDLIDDKNIQEFIDDILDDKEDNN